MSVEERSPFVCGMPHPAICNERAALVDVTYGLPPPLALRVHPAISTRLPIRETHLHALMKRAASSLLRQGRASSQADGAGRQWQRASAPLILVRHSHPDHHSSPVSSPVKRGVLFDAHREEGSGSTSSPSGSASSSNDKGKGTGKKPEDGDAKGGWSGSGVWDTALGIAAGTILLGASRTTTITSAQFNADVALSSLRTPGAGGTAYFAFVGSRRHGSSGKRQFRTQLTQSL